MRTATRIFLAGFAMLGFALAVPVTASASTNGTQSHPTGCNSGIADRYRTWAICKHGNGGHYRAIANCKDPETGKLTTAEGNWQSSGGASFAYCQGSSSPSVAGFETKYN